MLNPTPRLSRLTARGSAATPRHPASGNRGLCRNARDVRVAIPNDVKRAAQSHRGLHASATGSANRRCCKHRQLRPLANPATSRSPSEKIEEIGHHFPCGVNNAAQTARPGWVGHVVRDEALQKRDPIFSRDREGCFVQPMGELRGDHRHGRKVRNSVDPQGQRNQASEIVPRGDCAGRPER